MSRIGKKPVILTDGLTASLDAGILTVTGPKGTLTLPIHPKVLITIGDKEIIVDVAKKEDKKEKALWGLFRSLVANLIVGVSEGYVKELDVIGVGFKAELRGTTLVLSLGFSHTIDFELPVGITAMVEKKAERVTILQYQTTITLAGIDKQLIGETAAQIRSLKKPEPYKGKGIKYSDEVILRKAGKVVKAVGK